MFPSGLVIAFLVTVRDLIPVHRYTETFLQNTVHKTVLGKSFCPVFSSLVDKTNGFSLVFQFDVVLDLVSACGNSYAYAVYLVGRSGSGLRPARTTAGPVST